MRVATTVTIAAGLAAAVGCDFLKKFQIEKEPAGVVATGPLKQLSATDLVGYLNRQAAQVNSVRYPDVYVDVYAGKEHYTLGDSTLICAKPRNFLLVGGKRVIGEVVNIGSNDREFWMFAQFPEKTYVFCSHSDFQSGSVQLPFPFDPDWALQALGMTTYDPALPYKVDLDEKRREYSLTLDATTPQGQPIKKVVVFAADTASRTLPQVKRHMILDATGKTLAAAEVKEVAVVSTGPVPPQGRAVETFVQVPTKVLLDWPQQQFKMELKLRDAKVNAPMTEADAAKLFAKPVVDGVPPINLAEARFRPSSYRGATPTDDRPRLFRK